MAKVRRNSSAETTRRTSGYPHAVDRLIDEFASLPGIGRRSAERLAFHMLRSPKERAMALADAIREVKTSVQHCDVCWNLSDGKLCRICADAERDRHTVLVVEQPKDLIAIEQTGLYKGLYHVLMGRLSPLEGIGPEELTIGALLKRVEDPSLNLGGTRIREVVLGMNPTLEGDGTALHLLEELRSRGVAVSRLARGLPSGSQLEYANRAVLADAIMGRQRVADPGGHNAV
jgi:recombination protein RecR